MNRCVTCATPFGRHRRCPRCGSKQYVYEPTAEEIAEACEAIRAAWSTHVTKGRECCPVPPVEVTEVNRYPCGKRKLHPEKD